METVEPFESIFEITELLIARYGAIGIGAAMFAESAGVPFASAIVLLTSGTMILRGTVSFWTIFISSTLGITFGSIFSYLIGMLGSLVGKKVKINLFGQTVHKDTPIKTDQGSRSRVMALWEKYGNFSIFMAQLWGVTRTFISFPAGAMHMNFYLFILYTFLGGAIFSLIAIGASIALTGTMGLTIKLLRMLAGLSPWLLLILLALLIAFILLYYNKKKKSNSPFIFQTWLEKLDRYKSRN